MSYSPELLRRVGAERGRDLRAAAAARRLHEPGPARRRIARSLRRAADRLDPTTTAAGAATKALPGRC